MMLKHFILAILICSIVLTANLVSLVTSNPNQTLSSDSDTLQAAIQIDFNHTAIQADPECPTPTSGNGGGC